MGVDRGDSNKFKFFDNWDFTGDCIMTLDRVNNRVGINNSNPSSTLHINGDIYCSSFSSASSILLSTVL